MLCRVVGSGIYYIAVVCVYFDTTDDGGNPSYPSVHDHAPGLHTSICPVVVVYDICTIENTPTRSTDVHNGIFSRAPHLRVSERTGLPCL
jgi:hypothetical protein